MGRAAGTTGRTARATGTTRTAGSTTGTTRATCGLFPTGCRALTLWRTAGTAHRHGDIHGTDDFAEALNIQAYLQLGLFRVGVVVIHGLIGNREGDRILHQLHGRVGRGAAESWCFLVSDNASESVQKRLKFLCSTSDGFAVAQYDLETRGPGDFFGSRQHGLPTLQIADLMNDTRTLHAAQSEAVALLAEDPLLERPEHALLARQVEQMFDKAGTMN